jgi:hypothetical protein
MIRCQGLTWILALAIGLMAPSIGEAGILSGHPDAYSGWTGTASYDNGNNLSGDIDFAVFTASEFTANFGGLGYTPGDAYVYTYQVLNGGSDNFSSLAIGITNPSNTVGTFDIGAVDASQAAFDGSGNAEYQFFNPGIATGSDSWGLAFSSPFIPMDGMGLISDGGGSLLVNGLATPSNIPEPASAVLMVIAGGIALGCVRRMRTS